MKHRIHELIRELEGFAPTALQEHYDNSGLLIGDVGAEIDAALLCIDVTEAVVREAVQKKCGLIIAHHPLIFKGLKRLTGRNEVERCIIEAIKNDIAIYAGHTNFDNLYHGVNHKIAEKLGLEHYKALDPIPGILEKLVVFVPLDKAGEVRQAMFDAGAGHIGNYDSCSYNLEGEGSFRGGETTNPYVGEKGKLHFEKEVRIETVVPSFHRPQVVRAMIAAHPYEEVAYDVYPLQNQHPLHGAGGLGFLPSELAVNEFFGLLKKVFGLTHFRHTPVCKDRIQRVAFCGGAGSFLLPKAIAAGADVFVSGDFKYHEFFGAENKIIICDIGHYESEQFTKEVFYELLTKKFPNFALTLSEVNTNPVCYY